MTLKKYDIVNGADDNLTTIEATSAKAAMRIFKTQHYDRFWQARGAHAVPVDSIGRTRAAKARKRLRIDAARLEQQNPEHDAQGNSLSPVTRYWLVGVWDSAGALLWSSEPDSYDTKAAALAVARRERDRLLSL